MTNKKQFAVIGLGGFGGSVCKELFKIGHEVLAIDKDVDKISQFLPYSTHVIHIDTTDESSMRAIGISNFEHVVVAIGDNIQASILTTLLLKELKVPKVWVKAHNHYHHKVLEKIGADLVVHPESDMGKRIAHNMSSEKIIDFIDLSEDYSIVEIIATKKVKQKTLLQLNLRAKYGVTVLAIKQGENLNISPMPEDLIYKGDMLVVMGHKSDINRLEEEGL